MAERDPLAILAFDHRGEFSRSVFGRDPEQLDATDLQRLRDAKSLVFEAFLAAGDVGPVRSGILVDEEFGSAVARRSADRDFLLAMPVELADQDVFQFDYGDSFLEHVEMFSPDFAKALVRLNPSDDPASIDLQLQRLRTLSDALLGTDTAFMFELIVRPNTADLAATGGDRIRWEDERRAVAAEAAMRLVHEAGIVVDLWKLEGVSDDRLAKALAERARSFTPQADCVVLGAAADSHRVDRWLSVAASTDGFVGFAIGRNIWRESLRRWVAGSASADDVVREVSTGYRAYVDAYIAAQALA